MKIKLNFNFIQIKEIFTLTLPQMGLMLCHLVISMTDIWCAGKVHSNLQASLGIITQVFAFLMVLTSFIASGCMTSISQSLGAGLKRRANRYAGLIIMLASVSGTIVALLTLFLEKYIYEFLQVSPELISDLRVFFLTSAFSLPFTYLLIMINSVFRAYKKVWLPFCTLLVMAGGNFIGDLSFGLGYLGLPKLGAYGIAWTTFVCSVLGLMSNIFLALHYNILQRESFAKWKWNKKAMPYLFKVGMPSAFAQIINQLGSLTLLSIVGLIPKYSISILAGMSIALRIHSILLFPLGALNMSFVILSGYMLGAGKQEELFNFGKKSAIFTALIMIVPAVVLWLCRGFIIEIFSQDTLVQSQAAQFLTFICLTAPFAAASGILGAVFSGTGATVLSAKVNVAISWGLAVPLSYFSAITLGYGAMGIYCTELIAKSAQLFLIFMVYNKKSWLSYGLKKEKKI